jgi:peroxiredoxin
VDELVTFIDKLEKVRPMNPAEAIRYRELLEAAADKILELERDKNSDAYQRAARVQCRFMISRMSRSNADEQRAILDRIVRTISSKELTYEDVRLADAVARALDHPGGQELAAYANDVFARVFVNSSDSQVVSHSERFARSARRLSLVGNRLELHGRKLDGTKFDLTELKGKVVLVCFWATGVGPCRALLPAIRQKYDRFHDRGFEVVGVSVDSDRKALEKYMKENPAPWITLHDKGNDGKHSAAERCGLVMIPSLFLVGRDGNVISVWARGKELDRLLAEQFGDVEAARDAGS